MMIILITTLIIIPLISPIKLTFLLIISSIILRISSYWSFSSCFPARAVTLRFSSGIIIIFCYCSIIRNYEKKNNIKKIIIIIIRPILFSSLEELCNKQDYLSFLNIQNFQSFLIIAIRVIILSMIIINKAIFDPLKSLNNSY